MTESDVKLTAIESLLLHFLAQNYNYAPAIQSDRNLQFLHSATVDALRDYPESAHYVEELLAEVRKVLARERGRGPAHGA